MRKSRIFFAKIDVHYYVGKFTCLKKCYFSRIYCIFPFCERIYLYTIRLHLYSLEQT